MSKRVLTLRYFIYKKVSINVPDDVFTSEDIERIAQLESEKNPFDDCDDADWEWDVIPTPIKKWDASHDN